VVDDEEYRQLGLYDPADEHAKLRLELLRYLTELGATPDELVAYRDALPSLASVLAIRGGPAMTLEEVVERSGVSTDEMRRVIRTFGFADPEPDARLFTEGFLELIGGLRAAVEVFGEEGLYQLLRVLGSAMARVADAAVSAFLVNVEPAARREDPVGLAVARANAEAAGLLPLVAPTLDVLLRGHLLVAQRTVIPDEDLVGFETQRLHVGFVDLVGSTELGERVSMHELGVLLTSFERLATDTVTARGGRVVKLIGDQILYVAPDAASACSIALDLVAKLETDATLPAVRAGLAGGPVMRRDGDVFGPVVNLAARVVKVAEPGEVVTTAEVSLAAGLASEGRGRHHLKGITDEIELRRLVRG
jgi:class 3 adenylate cyclase